MNSTWQKISLRGLFLSNRLLGKLAGHILPKRTERLMCWNSIHIPASIPTTTKNFNLSCCQKNLAVKYRNGSPGVEWINPLARHSSSFGSPSPTSKWDGKVLNFVENENEYFHSYLESVAEYQPYFLSFLSKKESFRLPCESVDKFLQEVKERKKTDQLLLLLEHWSALSTAEGHNVLSNRSFSQTVKHLQGNIRSFSVNEILQSMVYLNSLGFRHSTSMTEPRRNRIIISRTFDQVCSLHVEKMDIRKLLLAADFFYSLRGSSFAGFNLLMCERMKLFLPVMTKPELILLLFHMSMTRKTPSNMAQTVLEHLKQHLNSLTLQELGIVNLAHYKTQTLVKQPEYFTALTAWLTSDADLDIDSICLSAVLKYQHRSLNRCKNQFLPNFFTAVWDMEDPLIQLMPKLSPETLMRVLNLYYSVDLLSESLFMTVIDRIAHGGVQDWRLKDVAKVVHILTNIPLESEGKTEALEVILADLQRREGHHEMDDYPSCLLQMAVALSYCGMYPHWLAGNIFGASAQKYFKDSKIDYRQDLYHLSQSISIEDSTYKGPLLKTESFPRLSKNKVYSKLMQTRKDGVKTADGIVDDDPTVGNSLFHRDLLLLELMKVLCQARPQVSPLPSFLLPHFHTADVELQHQQRSNSQDKEGPAFTRLSNVGNKDFVREAVVLHASNAYQTVRCRDGSTVPLLRQYHAMRVRQLRILGVNVIEVPHFEFEASSNKSQYLLTKFQQEEERLQKMGRR